MYTDRVKNFFIKIWANRHWLWMSLILVNLAILMITNDSNSMLGVLSSGLFTGILSGMIVWIVAVEIPEQKRRKIWKESLSRSYMQFRENLLTIFLFATERGIARSSLVEELQDYRKFRKYFGENDSERWFVVARWLSKDDNKHHLLDIHKEMQLLGQEAMHVRNHCNIQNEDIHTFLGKLSELSISFKRTNLDCDYEHRKSLMHFLWGIFAQWNFITGQSEEDPVQKMIDSI